MTGTREDIQARWLGIRAVYEQGVEPALIAAVSGYRLATILDRARGEGWSRRAGTGAAAERLAGIAARLVGEVEAIENGGASGGYDKSRIDAAMALLRTVEKLQEMSAGAQGRQEDQKRSDAEIAAVLARIDARIVELAEELYEERHRAACADREAAGSRE